MIPNDSSVNFSVKPRRSRRSWLPYFMAAVGAGAAVAEEELMRYHWVMPADAPEKAPRVIRVQGEKGERYEEVYAEETLAELKNHPAIQEARLARQAALRKEALELARQLRESGKEPIVAYEEAWTTVYSRNWLNARHLEGSCKLEDMLTRLADENEDIPFTEEEEQWLLEALLEDDDRLETEAGRELLRRLAEHLRRRGYGKISNPEGLNDELMQRFAAAMRNGLGSMSAYRDALFKTSRDSIMTHSVVGYRAPVGMGIGGGTHYIQAPQQVGSTESSGNTQPVEPPALTLGTGHQFTAPESTELPGSTDDFLASATPAADEEEEEEDDTEEDDANAAAPGNSRASAAPAMMMMRSFSMRSSAPAAVADTPDSAGGASNVLYWNADAGPHVAFGETSAQQTNVQIAEAGVMADTVTITGRGYQFSGGNLAVTGCLSTAESASVESTLVIGSTSSPLTVDVTGSATLTLSTLETSTSLVNDYPVYERGSLMKTGSGTLSITNAVHGNVAEIIVEEGSLTLGQNVTLDVGANRIIGGTLQNVKLQITGELERSYSHDKVIVHDFITSADGTNPAVLSNVKLHAGTSTEYATLHSVEFAGSSTLEGFITFEKSQAPGKMSVAAGGTLTVNAVTFDLRGLAEGEKVLIVNSGVDGSAGTLEGWDSVNFVYSGVAVNRAAVNASNAGVVDLKYKHDGNLYWNGATDDKWNPGSANWSSGENPPETFTALSNVFFSEGVDELKRSITVTQDMVVTKLTVEDGGYSFSGARVAVLGDASLNPGAGAVTFNNQLVVQGSLSTTAGSGSVDLLGGATIVKDATFKNLTTTIGGDMTVGGNLTVSSGDAATAGRLTITGNVTAQKMELAVSAGSGSSDLLVDVSGNLSVGDGSITIGGTAKQQYTGTVTAGELTVNTQKNDVYFSYLQVKKLTVGEGATVHVQTSSDSVAVSSSSFPVVDLSGTLALDAAGTTYNQGYLVNVKDDDAKLVFGTGCTIEGLDIIGMKDESGYTNLAIDGYFRSATVTSMQNIGTLTVNTGSLTVQNAGGAVYGDLVLDNAKLKLGAGSDNIMASDSGAVCLKHGSSLDIGSTTQTLYARNEAESLSLSGASTITGAADGGVRLENGVKVNYEGIGNSIEAKLTVGQNITLNATQPEDASSLEITGLISGSGNMNLTGKGIVVLYGANTDYTGTVTVGNGSTLTLLNADSLSKAGVDLGDGGTLSLNAPDAVNLNALTLQNGSSLAISSIVGTQKASTADAVLNTTTGVTFGQGDVVLNLIFSHELDTMQTYNIMTGVSSDDIDKLRLNVQHNGVELDDSQYKVFLGSDGLLYITTMMGNVWDGESDSQYWTKSGNGMNWSGDEYREDVLYKAAIFRDLTTDGSTQPSETVTVQGEVSPGDIYFTADATQYTLGSDGTDARLAAGTRIHKRGEAHVTLNLSNNASADYALGNVDVQVGSLILDSTLAVKDTVRVEQSADLVLNEGTGVLKMYADAEPSPVYMYTASAIEGASATLRGVTMDAAGIRGLDGATGSATNLRVEGNADLSWLTLTDFEANGGVALSHVTLESSAGTSSHLLENVTIGEGVVVEESGFYTLSGAITFESTLTNKGTLTQDKVTSIEIGKLKHTLSSDGTQYEYQLIKLEGSGDVAEHEYAPSQFTINGVKLENQANQENLENQENLKDGLKVDVDVKYDGKGTLTLSVDNGNVAIPQWDERWRKTESAPAFSRIYAGTGANFEIAEGNGNNTNYYLYSSIVNEKNAGRVNAGKAFVVTLDAGATGHYAAGEQIAWDANPIVDHEVWIYDQSGIKEIIGGLASWAAQPQSAATHILVDSDIEIENPVLDPKKDEEHQKSKIWAKHFIIGGSRWRDQNAESYVTVKNGQIYNIFGGSCGGRYNIDDPSTNAWGPEAAVTQTGTAHVFVDGGRVGEIFAAGYRADLIGTQKMEDGRTRAVEMVLTGGTIGRENLRVFGGTSHGTVKGDIYVRMEGDANVISILVGGSNAGTVIGDIVLDLISGEATMVEAAGKGWPGEIAHIEGDVWVNLYSDFRLGKGVNGGLYGGKETTNNVSIDKDKCYSRLHFAEGTKYELALKDNIKYDTPADSVVVTGFDRFELENKAHVVLGLGLFDINMSSDKVAAKELVISGKGVVEVIGHGIEYDALVTIMDQWGNPTKEWKHIVERNLGRDIKLENSATLKISTSVIGEAGSEDDRTITVTDGTTIDFSGAPAKTGYTGDSDYAGLGFNVVIEGYGVDGKGAIYKGKYDGLQYQVGKDATSTANRIVLPNVTLTGGASVKVEAGETLYMNADGLGETHLTLNKHTFTKLGAGDFIARSVEMTAGTVLVQQGTFGFNLTDDATKTDMVLSAGAELKLNATVLKTAGPTDLSLRSLSGAGTVDLNGSTLTLYTNTGAAYYEEYMTDVYTGDASSYDQFSATTGFGYAVFSGLIKDGSSGGSGKFAKSGSGVHYISGSSNTYTGGTLLQDGRLYLLGTSEASGFSKGGSEVKVDSGVAGTGIIEWDSSGAELYLGHGTRIYNNGTTNGQGGNMTIGVEGALSSVLAGYMGIHGTVTMGGEEYVEIDTHNLKSIAVNALYADGSAYIANEDINRNLMLLVKKSDWERASEIKVAGYSENGYNEAEYSGSLSNPSSGQATTLHKVGAGTLVLDQVNSYSGGTLVSEGTLRLRGWGTAGTSENANVIKVEKDGASLMFSYTMGYGDAEHTLANNISLTGNGDRQWISLPAEDEEQSSEGESHASGNVSHSTTDGLTAALISAVGNAVKFTLSGDISGAGNVLHSGDGTLVLSGDSSYTGGTVITRGVVEVQSATGLGKTAEGLGAVVLGKNAGLHVTVEPGTQDERLVTTFAAAGDDIQGSVLIAGTESTERVLHMEGNGYKAVSTELGENGTFLLSGNPDGDEDLFSTSGLLTGSGRVVVSDATGSGTIAEFTAIKDYTGDIRVEGDKAAIDIHTGSYSEGCISVEGRQASVHIGGNVSIVSGEKLKLHSTGTASDPYAGAALLKSEGVVSVAADAELAVSNAGTVYEYNIKNLQEQISLTPADVGLADDGGEYKSYKIGSGFPDYKGCFDSSIAINQQAAGAVQASGGLSLSGGAVYKATQSHISLMGSTLDFDIMENHQLTFMPTLDTELMPGIYDVQLVLFSDVSGVRFGIDNEVVTNEKPVVYYTQADRYLTGSDYIDSQTLLVYDAQAGVVYLQMKVPEPTTSTLGLLALTALCARRRRRG